MTSETRPNISLNTATLVAFDTETTGLFAPSNRLVEIAGMKFRLNDPLVQTFQSLINPERPIPEDVIQIHGITDAVVANAETAGPVLATFLAFCGEESILVAHNALFDLSFLYCELQRVGLPMPTNRVIDTVDLYKRLYPDLGSYSLQSLIERFKLADSQKHRALADAECVMRLLRRAGDDFVPTGIPPGIETSLTVYGLSDWSAEAMELPSEHAALGLAVQLGLRVEITYAGSGQNAKTRTIRPMYLATQNGARYLTAYCELAQAERTFRLDRIVSFRLLSD
ncbi:MAG TPA: exonuclease domain-containing protein [Candidatus Acidoferrum sp.]|nr:exonuclease domain-containing protein [Candidatus Acidoferrum sp.]